MAGFINDISMQEYYGSFPTTSAKTAVRRGSGIRKIQATPNLNAMGPSGVDDRDEDIVERVLAQNISPTQAGLNNRQTRIWQRMRGNAQSSGTTTSSGGSGSTGSSATPSASNDSAKKKINTMLIVGGAVLLVGFLVYRRFTK